MKGINGVQLQVHPRFIEWKKKVKNDRIKAGKEGNGELSDKRLSLTLVKYFNSNPSAYNMIINADIDLTKE